MMMPDPRRSTCREADVTTRLAAVSLRRFLWPRNPSRGDRMRSTVLILSVALAAQLPAQSPSYQITHTYPVGGDGSWDYVVPDAPHHRLFIGRQDRVMVVDENTGK